ncbi:MAG: hypothetical protein ABIF87_13630 [Pseudomonadota bacterium]
MKRENLPAAIRKKIQTQLHKKGIPPEKINPRFLSVPKAVSGMAWVLKSTHPASLQRE